MWKRPLLALAGVMGGLLAAGFLSSVAGQSAESAARRGPEAEFHFVRLAYSANGRHRMGQSWRTDWPEAEHHFLRGVKRLTRIDAAQEGRYLAVMDEEEAARLREYLLRGGFLMVDDFHGTHEWEGFLLTLQRVFPNRPIIDIPESDEALHVLYDLEKRVQIPSPFVYLRGGRTFERDGITPHWRGVYDDKGRLMVAINFNMDMGDAWEHADWPEYPEFFTALAYRFGINYIIYAMTH
jgi:hypothetical protein